MNALSFKKKTASASDESTGDAPDFMDVGVSNNGVLIHNRKKYAVGLLWLAAEDENQTKLAQQRGARIRADFFCTRALVSAQHGFGFLKLGHRVGMRSAAAVAADILVGEWHGVFQAENGWWYVAVLGDMIAPQGDLFFTTEEEIYRHFTSEQQKHSWPRCYTPTSWNIPNSAGEVPIHRLFDEDTTPVTLKALNIDAVFSGRQNKVLVFGALAVLFALLIGALVLGGVSSLLDTDNASISPQVSADGTPIQIPPELPAVLDPALAAEITAFRIPDQQIFIEKCMRGIDGLAVQMPGWNVASLSCQPGMVKVNWSGGEYASITTLKSYSTRLPKDAHATFDGSTQFSATQPMAASEGDIAETQEPISADAILLQLNAHFKRAGLLVTGQVITPIAQRIFDEAGMSVEALKELRSSSEYVPITNIAQSDLPYITFELQSEASPYVIKPYTNIVGLTLTNIEAKLVAGKLAWTYTGKVIPTPDKRIVERFVQIKTAQKEGTQ